MDGLGANKELIGVISTLFVAIFGALSGFGVAYFTQRQQRKSAKEDRLESHLFDSLKWFEGGTQKRSIGLSIVEGNWAGVKALRPTWTAVLVNQAVYLLSEKPRNKMSTHEMENRRRLCSLLKESKLTDPQRATLSAAIKEGEKTKRLNSTEVHSWNSVLQN